jgi:YHS domain-containing protein
MSKLAFAVVCGAVLTSASFGQAAKKTSPTLSCPICKMALSTKKTKANPVAITLKKGGKTYYCCPKCTMPASMLVKAKPATKKV